MDAQSYRKANIVLHFPKVSGLILCVVALVLVGCASLTDIAPGTALAQVEARFGLPAARCPAQGGGETLVWSTQPYGQTAWRARTDSQGRVGVIRPIFTDDEFATLRTGVWTQQDVLCAFGPPAERSTVGSPGVRQVVWSYRYRQGGVWNSLMYVYFGHDGVRLTHLHPGPDPLFEPDRRFPGF